MKPAGEWNTIEMTARSKVLMRMARQGDGRTSVIAMGRKGGDVAANFDLVATLYSQEMGAYARAGIGPAQYRVFAGNSESDPVGGLELLLGFGILFLVAPDLLP